MELPIEIAIRDVERARDLESLIRRRAEKLSKFHHGVMGCRVAVTRVRHRESSHDPHRIRIDLTVPRGNEIVVTEKSTPGEREPLHVLVNRAFEAAERRLKSLKQRQRYEVKSHEEPSGLVIRLFPEEGYGFLRSRDGRELYFHRNSVLADGFGRLEIGTEVRFDEEEGDEGPQASTVTILDKPGSTRSLQT